GPAVPRALYVRVWFTGGHADGPHLSRSGSGHRTWVSRATGPGRSSRPACARAEGPVLARGRSAGPADPRETVPSGHAMTELIQEERRLPCRPLCFTDHVTCG